MSGSLYNEKYISFAGSQVFKPEILLTDYGASTDELTAGNLKDDENRVISGSVLCGHSCEGVEAFLSYFS